MLKQIVFSLLEKPLINYEDKTPQCPILHRKRRARGLFVLIGILLATALIIVYPSYANLSEELPRQLDPLKETDRILILAPHPDDEALGCAGIIQEALGVGAQVKIAYLTNGDHNQVAFIVYEKRLTLRKGEFIHMGEVRRKEAIRAMALLGLQEKDLVFLGYPDFGTFTIFSRYWQTKKPFKSFLTRISSVPYKENLSYAAPYVGESILQDIKNVIGEYRPNKIFVSHPFDTNVDHKSFYLFLEVALADLYKVLPRPKVYTYLIHCIGWPLPRHYHPELNLYPPKKFSYPQMGWMSFDLSQEKSALKHKALLCYRSQTQSSAFYLLSFARKNELFTEPSDINLKKQSKDDTGKPLMFSGISRLFRERTDDFSPGGKGGFISDSGQSFISYSLADDSLLIKINKIRHIKSKFGALVYLFGYNKNIPFQEMPKIRILIRYNRFKIFDRQKKITHEGASLEIDKDSVTLKLPLDILGDPDFLLSYIKVHGGKYEWDATGFRKLLIK